MAGFVFSTFTFAGKSIPTSNKTPKPKLTPNSTHTQKHSQYLHPQLSSPNALRSMVRSHRRPLERSPLPLPHPHPLVSFRLFSPPSAAFAARTIVLLYWRLPFSLVPFLLKSAIYATSRDPIPILHPRHEQGAEFRRVPPPFLPRKLPGTFPPVPPLRIRAPPPGHAHGTCLRRLGKLP